MSKSEFLDITLYFIREIEGLYIIHKKKNVENALYKK